ncbi:MAG TPA: hypothetical protein VF472_07190 [Burkholderiaceae bacterium]
MASDKTNAANWAIARARWEGEPRCSYADVADFLGISKQAVGKRAVKEGWTKKLNLPAIAGRAHAIADKSIAREVMDASTSPGVVDDQPLHSAAVSPERPIPGTNPGTIPDSKNATPEMLAQAVEDAAVDARAQILKRHRTEWVAPRNQIYKALKSTDIEQAKLAKITAETLKLIQDGERKAWGLDTGEMEQGQVRIVIERQEGVRIVN